MDTMYDYLKGAHRRSIALLLQARGRAEKEQWQGAQASLVELASALENVMRTEEKVVFSACDDMLGRHGSPTEQLRADHQVVQRILRGLSAKTEAKDCQAFLADADLLGAVLQAHISKEESAFFPMMEYLLAGRRQRIMDQLESKAGRASGLCAAGEGT
jgi:iron-sulfur cluster repair protein YtfE (RIC family)